MDNLIKKMRHSKKLKTFKRKQDTYKFMKVKDYNKLKPLTYTILLKKTKIITKINGKIETKQMLDRGDYVLCGRKKEKFGHKLEKILDFSRAKYDLTRNRLQHKLYRKWLDEYEKADHTGRQKGFNVGCNIYNFCWIVFSDS